MNSYIKNIREKVGHDTIILVGSSVYVYNNGKVLLQKRRDNECWSSHGGAMEIGETPEETARRELLEETGLAAGNLELLGIFSGPDMFYTYPNGDKVYNVNIAYICRDFSGALLPETDETSELRWFDVDNIPTEISPPDNKPMQAFAAWAAKENAGF